METYESQFISEAVPAPKRRLPGRNVLIVLIIGALLFGLYRTGLITHAIEFNNPLNNFFHITPAPTPVVDKDYIMPPEDPNRLNILVMGIEGTGDQNAAVGGPLLTDSIEVFSYDKTTRKASLISIPRDLYVTIYGDKKDKLNTAYQYGYYHTSDNLQFIKDKVSQITGIRIDHVVIFDFSSFKEIVNAVGGIDITLDKPFNETQQWGYTFSLPAGPNHLDGQAALYYARSRYTSSDFDRSRRQQQIIFALKDKLLAMNLFSDPVKAFSILNLIRNDVRTDISIWDIKSIMDLARQVNFKTISKTVISTDNLVKEGRGADGTYILLPKADNLSEIKQLFANSLR